ncbi:MAG TPA: hypothetical protein VF145_00205 [Chitinophagaceae bacterium]
MKRIHNIDDLRREQKMIEQRRLQLEKELRRDWNDLKQGITGGGSSFLGVMKNRYAAGLVTQGLSFGAGLLARKFGGKIGGRIYSWLK